MASLFREIVITIPFPTVIDFLSLRVLACSTLQFKIDLHNSTNLCHLFFLFYQAYHSVIVGDLFRIQSVHRIYCVIILLQNRIHLCIIW